MSTIATSAFALFAAYAAIGNTIVLIILIRRRIPLSLMWAGVPFYLYGVCNHSSPPATRALTAFALSTNISALLAIPTLIWFEAISS
jgi:hypothetical protein